MSDRVEVRIVGDASSATAALARSSNAVSEAAANMRARFADIAGKASETFATVASESAKGAEAVDRAKAKIAGSLQSLKTGLAEVGASFKQGFAEGARQAEIAAERTQAATAKMKDSSGGLAAGFGRLRSMLAGLAIGMVAQETVKLATEFERLRVVLATLEGGDAQGMARFQMLKTFATETPFQLAEVVQAFGKLKAQGLDPSNEALRSYGNTASAMGKSLDQMVEAVADAAMGEFERLKEFGIKAQDAGDKVILTFKGQATEVRKNSEDIQKYLQQIGNTDFAGAMDRQMGTLGGKFSNLADAAANFADEVGQGGLSQALKDAIDSMTAADGSSTELARGIGQVLGVAVTSVADIIRTFGDIGRDVFSFFKQLVADTMGKSSADTLTLGNTLKVVASVVGFLADAVRTAFTAIGIILQTAINWFAVFHDVVRRALTFDFSGAIDAIGDGVRRQQDIAAKGYDRIVAIQADARERQNKIWAAPLPTPPAPKLPAITTPTGGGGASSGRRAGGGAGRTRGAGGGASSKPSQMDGWRSELQDGLLAEEQAGRDTVSFTERFWADKLKVVRKGTKEELEVKRELTRAQIQQARAATQEEVAVIRQGLTLKQGQVQNEIELSRMALEQKLADIDAEKDAGRLSAVEALRQKAQVNRQIYQLDLELERRLFELKRNELRRLALLYAEGTKERREYNRQIELLEAQHNQRMAVLRKSAQLKELADDRAVDQQKRQNMTRMTQSWAENIARMVTLQQGFAATINNIWASMVDMFTQAIARIIQQWILSLLIKEEASQVFHMKETLKLAKQAAAGAFAAVAKIPIIGPVLAPAAAAAAFAATIAFSAKDGYDVPALAGPGVDGRGGQLGVVHPREMVLPADLADKVRNGGGGGGGFHFHDHTGTMTPDQIMANRKALAKAIERAHREGHFTGRKVF